MKDEKLMMTIVEQREKENECKSETSIRASRRPQNGNGITQVNSKK